MARSVPKLVGVNMDWELYNALQEFAASTEHPDGTPLSLSEAARLLMREALQADGANFVRQNLEDVGYRAGYARALREFYEHMAKFKPSRMH
jgi:hypothetical protein